MARTQALHLGASLALAFSSVPAVAQRDGPDLAGAQKRYRECIGRKPFRFHTEGRELLAQTEQPEALQQLIADYIGSKNYPEYTRYTIASLIGGHFDDEPSVDPLIKLRTDCHKPVDAWLWAHALAIETNRRSNEPALAIAHDSKQVWQRAAAIVGLSLANDSSVFEAIRLACEDFPRKESDRYLLLGAMSGGIVDNRAKARDQIARAGMTAYINLLRPEVGLPHTALVQMARHLMWTLDGPGLVITPEPWLVLLAQPEKKAAAGSTTTGQPRFFGIETEGERFCYVVDLSDSMCKELDPEVIPKGPGTGPRPKRPKGELPTEADLPWHLMKTRFDLAREHLKLSLLRLTPDKCFSIVWFGTDAAALQSCPGLIKATPANVAKVIKELDSITAGPRDPEKAPDGTLRGSTNLHAGLRQAFGLSGKNFVEDEAYVDPGPLCEGCDTIFLLSDGAPSWDEFAVQDKDYGEGEAVVNTEYNKKPPTRAPIMNYSGPFHETKWLLEDFKRMNAFRRVRLHCIGIGEADMSLLRELARLGHGEVYTVGRAQPKGPGARGGK